MKHPSLIAAEGARRGNWTAVRNALAAAERRALYLRGVVEQEAERAWNGERVADSEPLLAAEAAVIEVEVEIRRLRAAKNSFACGANLPFVA